MAIRVNYTVPMQTAGPIAYAAGRGLFEQKQDQFNEERRRFDEQQAGLESRFARNLQYQQELAMLKDRQFQDQQAQQAYRFDTGLQATAYQREMDRRNRLQQLGYGEMFQRGREERADVRDIAGEKRADERQLSSETRQQQRREAEKQWLTANRDAELMLKKGLKPEQLEQAAAQWEQRNGRDFPYQGAMQERMGEGEGVSVARGILGDAYWNPSYESYFSALDEKDVPLAAFQLRQSEVQRKDKINELAATNQNRLDVRDADNTADMSQALITARNAAIKEEQTFLDKRFDKWMTPYKDENEATKQRDPQEAMSLAEKDLELRRNRKIEGQEAFTPDDDIIEDANGNAYKKGADGKYHLMQ